MVITHRNHWTAIGIVASDDPMLHDSVTLIRDGAGVWSEETLPGSWLGGDPHQPPLFLVHTDYKDQQSLRNSHNQAVAVRSDID